MSYLKKSVCVAILIASTFGAAVSGDTVAAAAELVGRIVDSESGEPLAARVYLRNSAGEYLFVESESETGTALPYREQWVPIPQSVERHTTISAHPFRIDLKPGVYELEVERGKEYIPVRETITVEGAAIEKTIELRRWINLAKEGWYSGETHVHRRIHELPNVMLAEDLNVAFPVTFWTVTAESAPDLEPSPLRRQGPSPFGPRVDRGYDPIPIDQSHVIVPRNTEYEIFNVGGQRHVLGAIFVLNHQSVFSTTAPPVAPIARMAHDEGALLDLDKHSWPWSMMLVPIAKIDLFELSNNSVWRTNFGFKSAPARPLPWTELEMDASGRLTEWGWLNYGFEMYYALLNCGFRISPSAGTASGVHPVPLGHSRVYVQTGRKFDLDAWLNGLKRGRSFVTTGPMLFATVNGKRSDEVIQFEGDSQRTVNIEIETVSERPLDQIEIVVNGNVSQIVDVRATKTDAGAWRAVAAQPITLDRTSWIAARCYDRREDGRRRFAHTAPWHISLDGKPPTPSRVQVRYIMDLLEAEIERNKGLLSAESMNEFVVAMRQYEELLDRSE